MDPQVGIVGWGGPHPREISKKSHKCGTFLWDIMGALFPHFTTNYQKVPQIYVFTFLVLDVLVSDVGQRAPHQGNYES